jgi:metallophosphoesterase superfamily enzyme
VSAAAATQSFEVASGVWVLPQSLVWIERTRTLVAADAHFAYEEVIGGALPLWSTGTSTATLSLAIARTNAAEVVLLGDVIHGSPMSEGAQRIVRDALATLREACPVVVVAGNHEGRTRGTAVLGETVESCERDGWTLCHGDRPYPGKAIVGHLHPSLHVGGGESMPAALGSSRLVVVPALTPYSAGLNAFSPACASAVRAFGADAASMQVVASGEDRVYPFGELGELQALLRGGARLPPNARGRKVLRRDQP